MWRGLVLFQCIWTIFKVSRAWKSLELEAYWNWLQTQSHHRPPLEDLEQIEFATLWIGRLTRRLMPERCCVVAASSAFLLFNQPITLTFGVKKEGDQLLAHAWAQWPQGKIDLNSQIKYDPLWEMTRPSV